MKIPYYNAGIFKEIKSSLLIYLTAIHAEPARNMLAKVKRDKIGFDFARGLRELMKLIAAEEKKYGALAEKKKKERLKKSNNLSYNLRCGIIPRLPDVRDDVDIRNAIVFHFYSKKKWKGQMDYFPSTRMGFSICSELNAKKFPTMWHIGEVIESSKKSMKFNLMAPVFQKPTRVGGGGDEESEFQKLGVNRFIYRYSDGSQ